MRACMHAWVRACVRAYVRTRARARKVRVRRVIRARRDPSHDLRSTKVRRRLVGREGGRLFFKGGVFSTVTAKLPDRKVTGMRAMTIGTTAPTGCHRVCLRERETRDPETVALAVASFSA